jgi:hypothetical protein
MAECIKVRLNPHDVDWMERRKEKGLNDSFYLNSNALYNSDIIEQ